MDHLYKPLDNNSKALVEKRLAAYAAAAGLAIAAFAPAASAQIVYTDQDPDAVVTTGSTFEIDFDGDARTDVTINVDSPFSSFYRAQAIADEANNAALVGYGPVVTNYNYFYASVLASFDAISSGNTVQNTNSGRDDFVLTSTFFGTTYGLWQGATDGYLGVKFEDGGGDTHYAWVRLDVPDSQSVTVKDWAYESAADTPINAGITPVELISFDAQVNGDDVVLTWATASETNNAGFEVQMKQGEDWSVLNFVDGNGTTTEAQTYSFTAAGMDVGTHTFRLKQIDFDGAFEYLGELEVSVEVVGTHQLSNAYPNPFNPSSQFTLAVGRDQHVTAEMYNVLGQRVATLFNGALEANAAQIVQIDGASLASGAYIVRVQGETFADALRVTLTK